jgi:PAS domain S-box-containing protein
MSDLRALSESLPQQVWASDPAGKLTFVNSVVVAYFRRTEAEVLGDGWLGVLHPDDVEKVVARWVRSLQTGEDYQVEFRLRRHDSTFLWHLGRARPVRDAEGKIESWLGTNTDIDEQIRAREKIAESARSFQALAETIPQMCWAARPDGVIDYYNQQWLDYTGEGGEVGASLITRSEVHDAAVYPEVVKRWTRSLETGEPFEMEMPLRRAADGTYRMHLTRAVALKNPAGTIVRWFGTSTDIEDQRAEMMRRLEWEARERQLRHIALRADVSFALTQRTSLPEMLQFCAEAMVTHLGAAFARVWTLNEAGDTLELQASAGMYTHLDGPHGRVPVGKFKIGLIAEERRAHFTNDVPHDERVGDQAWAAREGMQSFAGYPLIAGEKLLGVIAMFARRKMDLEGVDAISSIADVVAQGIARKNAEEALELHAKELARSNAELERFSYIASHDLQEPLRMVASYTQLLGRRYKGKLDKDADEFIAFAVDGAQRMQTLINDLLAFSRVGTKPGAMSEVNLEVPLKTALLNLRGTIEERKAVVTYGPLPSVLAYDRQLIQLFQNLIGNAIKFGNAATPTVHVEAKEIEGGVQVSVKDNGIGIDPLFFDRLFVVFQRLNNRTEYAGNGIGLAICKKIVERHNGTIWVESKLGEGATFLFTLKGPTP